jgi:bisanhydrobacterioruberin hydratase
MESLMTPYVIRLKNVIMTNRSGNFRDWAIIIFYFIFFSVGVAGLSFAATRPLFINLMPVSLILSAVLMFYVHQKWQLKHFIIFAAIASGGYLVEVAGVLTGIVFGEYSYGGALGVKLFNTPLMIGLNWLMLVYALYVFIRKTRWHPAIQTFAASTLMVIYDVIMEPVAMQLDMWDWANGIIPLQNYIAWFVISVIMFSALHLFKIKYTNRVAPALFFIQMGFFLALRIFV